MYDVDLSLWSLNYWMSMMCGSVCSVCISSWIHGRLELMHLVFQLTNFKVVAQWLSILVLSSGV